MWRSGTIRSSSGLAARNSGLSPLVGIGPDVSVSAGLGAAMGGWVGGGDAGTPPDAPGVAPLPPGRGTRKVAS